MVGNARIKPQWIARSIAFLVLFSLYVPLGVDASEWHKIESKERRTQLFAPGLKGWNPGIKISVADRFAGWAEWVCWRSFGSSEANACISYATGGTYWYMRATDVSGWATAFKKVTIGKHGPNVEYDSPLGELEVSRIEVTSGHVKDCFTFSRTWAGNKSYLRGWYCAAVGELINDALIRKIVSGIGVKDIAVASSPPTFEIRSSPSITSSRSATEIVSSATDLNVCIISSTVVLNPQGFDELKWETDDKYDSYVEEAKRRRLSLTDCSSIRGLKNVVVSDGHNKSVASLVANQAVVATTVDEISPTSSSKTAAAPKPEIIPTDTPMVATKNANVRKEPDTSSVKVGFLLKGEAVNMIGRVKTKNWALVERDGATLGYVYSPLLADAQEPKDKPIISVMSSLAPAPNPIARNPNAVAVIIGNRTYQGRVPAVDYAHNDADAMKRFVIERLGYRVGNVIDLRDATQADLSSVFGSALSPRGKLWRWVRPGASDVTIFYSGHGVPGIQDRRSYLLPVDADPNEPAINGYPLERLYENLAQVPARSITVYLDACFSGDSPKGMLIRATSGLTIESKPLPEKLATSITVLTAAGAGELASWDEKAEHGLFTRYLLEALEGAADKDGFGDGDGKVTVVEIKRYLDREMTYAARRIYGRDQNASVFGNEARVVAVVGD